MNATIFISSASTLSWIDQKTGLPEHDGAGPPYIIKGVDLTKEDNTLPFRFLNLAEATIAVDGSRIISADWGSDSGIYRNPSFARIKSEPFKTLTSISRFPDRIIFKQTTGARTVSPEVIGEFGGGVVGGPLLGRYIGRKIAHALSGFPPIWTMLKLTLFADGRSETQVVAHSLFPSMSFYRPTAAAGAAVGRGATPSVPRQLSTYMLVGSAYDARPKLEAWKTDGWGPLPENPSGPTKGNPWGYKQEDLTIRDTDSDTRVV
jgi:hypothetical protein